MNISNSAKLAFSDEIIQVTKTSKSFDSIKLAIETVVSAMHNSVNSINLIEKGKISLSDNISNISMVAERSAAATQEVSASVEDQNNSNENMHSLAMGLNNKAASLKGILDSFKF